MRSTSTFISWRLGAWGLLLGLVLGVPIGVSIATKDIGVLFGRFGGGSGTSSRSAHADFLQQFDLAGLAIPRKELLHGGPPKDGIPSLIDPQVTPLAEVDFLDPDERIVGIVINGEARAYPIRLLNYHEAVNDEVGGQPVTVIYCPLCDSVSVLDPRINGRTLTFGISGLLHNSNVLLYDRETEGLWSQLGFEAISGPFVGRSLAHLPWEIAPFEDWSARHPDSLVATFETGHARDYTRSPYEAYFAADEPLYFPVSHLDERLPIKEPIIGVRLGQDVRAYTVRAVRAAPDGRLEDLIGEHRLVIEADADGGRVAVVESPAGAQVAHTFWFSWAAFHPDTELIDG